MRSTTQRDVMRALYRKHRGDESATVAAYAAAERSGQVPRSKNTHDIGAEAYAQALFNDGIRKGWLRL